MFGVCLWEMVAGELPWAELPTGAVGHAVLSGERLAVPLNCDPVVGATMLSCWQVRGDASGGEWCVCVCAGGRWVQAGHLLVWN
jgi:hypothetical protein